jgi:ATP-binding cassette subfamily F protein 3
VLWLVDDGRVTPFDGDLEDYRDWVLARQRRSGQAAIDASPADGPPTPDRKALKRAEAEARQKVYAQRKPLADRLARIEREMDALGAERRALEGALASPDTYTEANKEALKQTLARQSDIAWQLARLEAEWLEVSAALELING